jgi:hypothetical protein
VDGVRPDELVPFTPGSTPRVAMVRALAAGIASAFEAGDTAAARVGIDALRALVDVAVAEERAVEPGPKEGVPESHSVVMSGRPRGIS